MSAEEFRSAFTKFLECVGPERAKAELKELAGSLSSPVGRPRGATSYRPYSLAVIIQILYGPFDLTREFNLPSDWVERAADYILESKIPSDRLFIQRGKRVAGSKLPSRVAIIAALRRARKTMERELGALKAASQAHAIEAII